MPFTILTNDSTLEINWSDDDSATKLNIDQLNQDYEMININGANNNEFFDYQILNRTKSLGIYQCVIDLSQIKGHINYISLTECTCLNNFSECSTNYLYIQDAKLKVTQLKLIQIEYLSTSFTEKFQFDLYNCNELTYKLNNLSLIKQNIDLTQLQGSWKVVQFDNCIFSGQVDNNLFKAKDVNLMINEENCRNNLDALENLVCNQFYLSQTEHDDLQHQIFPSLTMSNENNQKFEIFAYFENSTIDLSKISPNWHNLSFFNCKLIGDSSTYISKFTRTAIDIKCNQQYGAFDLNPLQGIEAILDLEFANNQIDLQLLQECKPAKVKLFNYKLDIESLCGTWNILWLQQCNIQQTEISTKVVANQIRLSTLNSLDSTLFNYFVTQKFEVTQTTKVTSYPNACELAVTCSSLNITQANDTIKHLSLNDVELVRFSILQLRSLESFNINTARDDPSYKTKECILSFLRHKKKNANRIKNFETRIINEQKRINAKIIRVERLKNCFKGCQVLKRICSDNE
ncbi:Hypothetical_protein [Hexamita inflata]|uniref:Hypothetical_protein n=1 Tax=Hexamita inflata TaxID=28002 RepID=A0AA86U9D1_9EUKA|nr:Hypothetical protein HINF_LOCUS31516 [Hexamita inflata]